MTWQLTVTAAGWVSTVALLAGYALVSTGRMAGDGRTYQLVNVVGSVGLGAAAFSGRVWPSVALNMIWALIGLAALNRLRSRAACAHDPASGVHDGTAGVQGTDRPRVAGPGHLVADAPDPLTIAS